jgi:hypothetical protein
MAVSNKLMDICDYTLRTYLISHAQLKCLIIKPKMLSDTVIFNFEPT